MHNELFAQLQRHMPPLFAATKLDELTGGALIWRTVKNIRCNKDLPEHERIPEECFIRQGPRKTLIVRDPFLHWWRNRIARQNPTY